MVLQPHHSTPLAPAHHILYYQVASEMFPKLRILLLLYKTCTTIVNFFFLDQNHSVPVGISVVLPFPQLQLSGLLHSLEVTRW